MDRHTATLLRENVNTLCPIDLFDRADHGGRGRPKPGPMATDAFADALTSVRTNRGGNPVRLAKRAWHRLTARERGEQRRKLEGIPEGMHRRRASARRKLTLDRDRFLRPTQMRRGRVREADEWSSIAPSALDEMRRHARNPRTVLIVDDPHLAQPSPTIEQVREWYGVQGAPLAAAQPMRAGDLARIDATGRVRSDDVLIDGEPIAAIDLGGEG